MFFFIQLSTFVLFKYPFVAIEHHTVVVLFIYLKVAATAAVTVMCSIELTYLHTWTQFKSIGNILCALSLG